MNSHQVILVDEQDRALATAEKLEAHEKGWLHRAFSVFIFNGAGEMLLQQRALTKYHSAGLWSNACCSHPGPGEDTALAARRRLREEMGFTADLRKAFDFRYQVSFENGLSENEFDHVFVGEHDGEIRINPEEVRDYSFRGMHTILHDLETQPGNYTAWFHIAFPKIEAWLRQAGVDDRG